MNKPLFIRIKRETSNLFVATCNQLPGCVSQGRTYLETVTNIGEAIQAWARAEIEKQVRL